MKEARRRAPAPPTMKTNWANMDGEWRISYKFLLVTMRPAGDRV
jgi:hypothetical protein